MLKKFLHVYNVTDSNFNQGVLNGWYRNFYTNKVYDKPERNCDDICHYIEVKGYLFR